MPGKTTVIYTDGQTEVNEHVTMPSLGFMQVIVNGPIEVVPYFTKYNGEPCVAFCNEEGKLPHMGLKSNPYATALWHAQGYQQDYLIGNILIVQGDKAFMAAL